MKILVTGASGFIAPHLIRHLTQAGHTVVATYRREPPAHLTELRDGVTWRQIDLTEGTEGLEPVDAVIHAAAVHFQSRRSPTAQDLVASNVIATLHLAEFAARCRVRTFIHLSTVTVHGEVTEPQLTVATPIREPNLYGATKYAGERILQGYASEVPTIVLRLPGVVGPGYFLPWMGRVLQAALRHEPIRIYNGDAPFNNITDVEDLSALMDRLLERTWSGYQAVPVGAAEPLPLRTVVELVTAAAGSRSAIIEEPAARSSFSIDIEPLKRATGFQPSTTRTQVERYVRSNLEMAAPCGVRCGQR